MGDVFQDQLASPVKSDDAFVDSLRQRISAVEDIVTRQQRALKEKQAELQALLSTNRELRGQAEAFQPQAGGEDAVVSVNALLAKESQNEALRLQLDQMLQFLSEYGIPAPASLQQEQPDMKQQAATTETAPQDENSHHIDYDVLIRGLNQVRHRADTDRQQVKRLGQQQDGSEARQASLAQRTFLKATVFKDGFHIEDEGFTNYNDDDGRAFLRALQAGETPAALRAKFPHGVGLRVLDRRHTNHLDSSLAGFQAFQGQGIRLGGGLPLPPNS